MRDTCKVFDMEVYGQQMGMPYHPGLDYGGDGCYNGGGDVKCEPSWDAGQQQG